MTVSGSGHHRLKDFNRLNEGNPITVQHMPDCKIAFHQQVGLRKLSGKVQVTHLPCPMSGFPLIGVRYPEDLFRLLIYYVIPVLFGVKANSMSERGLQIETEVCPILRLPAPSSFGKDSPFHGQ